MKEVIYMTIGERMRYARAFAAGEFPNICKNAALAFTKTVITTTVVTYVAGFLVAGLGEEHDDRVATKTEED